MGDAEGNFNPDANVTRAQFITVLWRMAGKPDSSEELPFTDTESQIPEFKSLDGTLKVTQCYQERMLKT